MAKKPFSAKRMLSLLAILSMLVATYFLMPLKAVVVVGDSMSPTLTNRQVVTVDRRLREPTRGRIAVFAEPNGGHIIKRIFAVAGEHVWELHIDEDVWEFIDDEEAAAIERVIAMRAPRALRMVVRQRTVPEGYVYISGDGSRSISGLRELSRMYGQVVD
jgi:signal peptidase I